VKYYGGSYCNSHDILAYSNENKLQNVCIALLLGAFALLLPIGIQFVNFAVTQCLLLANRAGRRKSKDFKNDCILSKQSAVLELLSYDRMKITSVHLLKAPWLLHVLPAVTSQILHLPTDSVYVFYMDLRGNCDYFPIQH